MLSVAGRSAQRQFAALLALLAVAPVFASVTYSPLAESYAFGVGLYDPTNPNDLNSVHVSGEPASQRLVFTFAAHMNQIYYNAQSLHFNFVYDNSCVQVLGARPVNGNGVWANNNYQFFVWPNFSNGFIRVFSLQQHAPSNPGFVAMPTSLVVPFFQVSLRVKPGMAGHSGLFGITQMTLESHTFALTLFPDDFEYGLGTIQHIPEPSGLLLLTSGCAALGCATLRRRERLT